jgi:hypothetical protein
MTYFSPLRRLSPTVEFVHHPNLDLFSDHRKSIELFRNLPKSHWNKAQLKSNKNTSSLLAHSAQPAWPSLPAGLLMPPSPPQPAQPFSDLGLPASPNRHHRPAHLASRPTWPKRPTVLASSPTSGRSRAPPPPPPRLAPPPSTAPASPPP